MLFMLYNFMVMEAVAVKKVFSFYRFSGSHDQIGQQYGSACRELIKKNLDLSMHHLQEHTNATREQILNTTLQFRPYVLCHAPFLDEEIQGVSESTGLRLEEIYFLQLRAEIQAFFFSANEQNPGMECTSFAISGTGSSDRYPLGGQNADLPAFYSDICIVVEITPDDQPAVLMVTPAGQVSYIGMNRSGLCTFANYLVCDGWREGFPRYCLTRLALTQDTVSDAERILLEVQRASSRNILMVDARGEILDLELAVQRHGRLIPTDGRLIHSNHFLSPELLGEERASTGDKMNSQQRLLRLQQLIDGEFGSLDADKLKSFLRDRQTYPDPICIEPGDLGQGDEMTVVSVIAEPASRCIWAAVGPPSRNRYQRYSFTE
jgi:isopenicillin-N N-acyltransferase-like protein